MAILSLLNWAVGLGAWKAHAGGLVMALSPLLGPLFEQFGLGFAEGFGTTGYEVGQMLGEMAARYVIGFVGVWIAPKNREPKA